MSTARIAVVGEGDDGMQLVASVALIMIGLFVAVRADASDLRIFGWVVVGVGVLGLLARWWLARLNAGRSRPKQSGLFRSAATTLA